MFQSFLQLPDIMKVLTAARMQEVDRRTIEQRHIPGLLLMENAGAAAFDTLIDYFPDLGDASTVVLCGGGNNGGDGFVVARRLLMAGAHPEVVLFGQADRLSGDAATQWQALQGWQLQSHQVSDPKDWEPLRVLLEQADIVVDALLGTGLNKPLEGLLAEVVEDVNDSAAFILAIDIPTGMFADSIETAPLSVRADATVTFTAPKIAHVLNQDLEAVGELHVAQIGTPPSLLTGGDPPLELLERETVAAFTPVRRRASHKGTFGHVAVIAGGAGKAGAAVLAARAALHAGAGLVTVMTPETVQPVVASFQPELMTHSLPSAADGALNADAADRALEQLRDRDAAALGPGMGTGDSVGGFIRSVVDGRSCPLVLDADGLNAFEGSPELLDSAGRPPLVLTPHPGEFARLTGSSVDEVLRDQLQLTARFARRHSVWVVLKTFRPLIATPEGQLFVSPCGNSGMATAGMGDCLTGILAALLAAEPAGADQDRLTTAVTRGVFIHGLAGDAALERSSAEALTAGDLIDSLAVAFRRLESGE